MCGISAVAYKSRNTKRDSDVKKMCDLIVHRGPDDYGSFYNERVALGQRRLSIIDLSQDGHQPMSFAEKYKVVFNGEIYNYIELREELKRYGYSFHTNTDTEVLLACYDKWGVECLNHFNGMWAFVLLDLNNNLLFSARDRFGVKPLYYHVINDNIYYASEIKEFTILDGWKSEGNIPRIVDFIRYGGAHDFSEETLFKNVFQIPGGCYSIYDLAINTNVVKRWYDLAEKKNNSLSKEDSIHSFLNIFTDSIRLRLRSDVKVGSCLSGGLDSSSIVCIVNDLLKREAKESSQEVVFAENHNIKLDESYYEKAVVSKTGVTEHKVQMEYASFMNQIEKVVWHQDEPFGSTSISAQWNVYKEAKHNDMIVMLDGQGADEYLAGYNSFHRVYFRELLSKGKLCKLISCIRNYHHLYYDYYYSPFRDLAKMLFVKVSPPKIYQALLKKHMSLSYDNVIKWALFDDKYERIRNSNSCSVKEETISEIMYVSLPKLLHHQDRNAMAHSVEARAPFLDYRLVEFVYNLPSSLKIHNGIAKYILREAMQSVLPEQIYNRMDKLGFATPQSEWIYENSSEFRRILEESCNRLSSIINTKKVMSIFDKNTANHSEYDSILWCIYITGVWMKVFDVKL